MKTTQTYDDDDKLKKKLRLNWSKLSSNWDWYLLHLTCIKLMNQIQWDQCTQDNSEGSNNSSKNKFYNF